MSPTSGPAPRRLRVLLIMLGAALALLATVPAADAAKKARSLGPTPVENDCLIYRGDNPCYYGLWSGRFEVDKHVLHVGDVLTTTIQTYGGFYPYYFWASPGGPGLKDLGTNAKNRCPNFAPPGPKDGSPNYFTLTCSFKAVDTTKGWVVIAPDMGLASSVYPDGDYYAVTSGASITGRVLNGKGLGVGGVRINISGPSDVYAVTDAAGFYDAIELKPGTYTVSVGKSKFCVDAGVAISSKTCKKSVSKRVTGNVEVNFKGLGDYAVTGVVKDEFGRGLVGVKLVASGLPGGETITLTTALDGSYRLGLEDAFTVTLTSQQGGYPYAFYYVVKPDGKASTGTAADITPNKSTPNVKVNWELDKRLYYNIPGNATHATADGFSNRMWVIQVLTQHGDPVRNEAIDIEPSSASSPLMVCSADDKPLWPTLFSDGTIDRIGGFSLKTDANGKIPLQIYPGSSYGAFLVTLLRKKNRADFTTGGLAFDDASGTPLGSGLRARAAVISGGVSAVGLFPSIESIVEWWAQSRRNGGASEKAGLDIMIVKAGASRGLAIFPRGQGPSVDATTGAVGASDKTYVLSPSDFRAFAGMGPLPLIGDWAAGQPITIERSDPRTYAGGPIPVRYGGVGSCLDGATGGTSLYTVHSPVNLQLTDKTGKALGINAAGKPVATVKDGIVYKNGESVAIIAPAGAYKASIVATGKGPVTIESDTARGGSTSVRFDAVRRRNTTVNVASGAGIGTLKYNRKTVRPFAGSALKLVGLPRSYRRLMGSQPIDTEKAAITDLNGRPVLEASVEVKAASGEVITLTSDRTGHLHGYWPSLKKGTRVFTLRAPGFTTTQIKVRVR